MAEETPPLNFEKRLKKYLNNDLHMSEFTEEQWIISMNNLSPDEILQLVDTTRTSSGWNVVYFAALRGHVATINVIANAVDFESEACFEILKEQDSSKLSPLMKAACSNKSADVVRSIFRGLSPKQKLELIFQYDKHNNTALHYLINDTVKNDYEEPIGAVSIIMKSLQAAQAFKLLKIKGRCSKTPLQLACEAGFENVIQHFREIVEPAHWAYLLTQPDSNNRTAAHYAAKNGCAESMYCLLESLESDKALSVLNVQDKDNATPLHLAALNNCAATCKQMFLCLTQHHSLELLKMFNNDGQTAMHLAIMSDDGADGKEIRCDKHENGEEIKNDTVKNILDVVESEENRLTLLKMKDYKNQFPFLMAVLDNRCSVVQTMHDSITSEQWLLLLTLSDENNMSVLHKLVEQHSEGGSKLMETILNTLDNDEMYQLLCAQNLSKQTVVHLLAENVHSFSEIFQLITHSMTQLQWLNILKLVDRDGATAVHKVARAGSSHVIKVILDNLTSRNKLDILDALDNSGNDAEDIATAERNVDAKREIRKHKRVNYEGQNFTLLKLLF